MNRLDPFDFVFGELDVFPAIRDHASSGSVDATDRARFLEIPAVRDTLSRIQSSDLVHASPLAADEYAALLHVAYCYWAAGRHALDVPRSRLEPLLQERLPELPAVPHGACYLRFPERWFWARIDEGQPAEPLDGLFVAVTADGGTVMVLAVLGLRPGRAGLSQIAVTATVRDVLAAQDLARSPAFAPALDGGALAGVHSIAAAGELLHLTALALAATDR